MLKQPLQKILLFLKDSFLTDFFKDIKLKRVVYFLDIISYSCSKYFFMEEYMIPCLSKKFLGIECLGCGTQRALVLLIQGEFKAAFDLYPAIYSLLIFFIFLGLHFLDKTRNYTKIVIFMAIINAIIMVISYIYKHFI